MNIIDWMNMNMIIDIAIAFFGFFRSHSLEV